MAQEKTGNMRWDSLDCLKGVACIAVVLIHYNVSGGSIPAWIGGYTRALCRFAVPIFLCISGFFFTGSHYSAEKTLCKIKNVLKLLFGSSIFYAVYAVLWSYAMEGAEWSLSELTAETITGDGLVKLIVTHDPLKYSHLWYLIALVWCYGIMLLLYKHKYREWFYAFVPVLLVCYSCMQEFQLLPTSVDITGMESPINMYNSFLFRALPFFIVGMIFREYQQQVEKMPYNNLATLSLMIIAGGAMEIIEYEHFGDSQYYFGSYLIAFAAMAFAIKHPNAKWKPLAYVGAHLSIYVYILHIAVGKLLDVIGKYAHWWGKEWYYISCPIMILTGTLILAEVLYRTKLFMRNKREELRTKEESIQLNGVSKHNLKLAFTVPLFFIGLVVTFFGAEFLLQKLDPRTFCTMYDLKQTKGVEFVVVGNSMAAANLDPEVIDEELETTSFLLTKGASVSYCASTMVEYMYELGHQPQRLVLMFDPTFAQYSKEDLSVQTTFTPWLSLKNRVRYTMVTADKDGLWLDRIFPLRTQTVTSVGEFITDLKGKFFPKTIYEEKAAMIRGSYTYAGRGHTPYEDRTNEKSLEEGSHRLSDRVIDVLPEHVAGEIERIVAICEKNDCDVIFTTTPIIRNKAFADKALLSACNSMAEFCAQNGYTYINFTYTKPEYMPDYNQGGYFDKGDHLMGSLVPEFTRSVYCRVLKDYYDGKDISHYFYTYEEWADSLDFISDAWFVSSEKDDIITYTAYAHHGTPVQPLFQFVQVAEDGSETVLREYNSESVFSIAKDEIAGQVRMYAINGADVEQEPLVYELN